MLLTVRKPGRRRARCSHNYVGDIFARFQLGLFSLQTRRPLRFRLVELTGGEPPSEHLTHAVSVLANMALSAATGVAEPNSDAAFTGEDCEAFRCW